VTITPEQVVAAYRSSGLRARRSDLYSSEEGCACGLGVILHQMYGSEVDIMYDLSDTSIVSQLLDLSRQYVIEFMAGFDSTIILKPKTSGYYDGQRAWQACVAEDIIAPYGRRT
jgi:hypothetical protein